MNERQCGVPVDSMRQGVLESMLLCVLVVCARGSERKTENFERIRIGRTCPHSPAPTLHIGMQNRLRSIFHDVPTCPRVVLMKIQSIKFAIFRVQNGEILTLRILTHEVEADQASVIHRWSTHTTTLTRVGSIGFA
jgi:hypothetical protein